MDSETINSYVCMKLNDAEPPAYVINILSADWRKCSKH